MSNAHNYLPDGFDRIVHRLQRGIIQVHYNKVRTFADAFRFRKD